MWRSDSPLRQRIRLGIQIRRTMVAAVTAETAGMGVEVVEEVGVGMMGAAVTSVAEAVEAVEAEEAVEVEGMMEAVATGTAMDTEKAAATAMDMAMARVTIEDVWPGAVRNASVGADSIVVSES